MSSTFIAYVDESGDEGFSFGKGSSGWFVLAAALVRQTDDLGLVRFGDEVRQALNKPPRKHLHFKDIRHEQRLLYLDRIASLPVVTFVVACHKPTLKEPEKFSEHYRLYFYSVRLLLERLSWFCRDSPVSRSLQNSTCSVVFSNRAAMSYAELRTYVTLLKTKGDAQIDWNSVSPDLITAIVPTKRMGLQLADAIAGSYWYALEPTQYGFTEPRYVGMVLPRAYHHKGAVSGYGFKAWPREVDINRLDWLPKQKNGPGSQEPT